MNTLYKGDKDDDDDDDNDNNNNNNSNIIKLFMCALEKIHIKHNMV